MSYFNIIFFAINTEDTFMNQTFSHRENIKQNNEKARGMAHTAHTQTLMYENTSNTITLQTDAKPTACRLATREGPGLKGAR